MDFQGTSENNYHISFQVDVGGGGGGGGGNENCQLILVSGKLWMLWILLINNYLILQDEMTKVLFVIDLSRQLTQ